MQLLRSPLAQRAKRYLPSKLFLLTFDKPQSKTMLVDGAMRMFGSFGPTPRAHGPPAMGPRWVPLFLLQGHKVQERCTTDRLVSAGCRTVPGSSGPCHAWTAQRGLCSSSSSTGSRKAWGKTWTTYRLRECIQACAAGTGAGTNPYSPSQPAPLDGAYPSAASDANGGPSQSGPISREVTRPSPSASAPLVDYVYTDPVALKLQRRAIITWPHRNPSTMLIVKKSGSAAAAAALQEIAE